MLVKDSQKWRSNVQLPVPPLTRAIAKKTKWNKDSKISGLNTIAWSSINGDSIDWGSIGGGSVDRGSVDWGSIDWGSIGGGSVDWGSIGGDSVDGGSVDGSYERNKWVILFLKKTSVLLIVLVAPRFPPGWSSHWNSLLSISPRFAYLVGDWQQRLAKDRGLLKWNISVLTDKLRKRNEWIVTYG